MRANRTIALLLSILICAFLAPTARAQDPVAPTIAEDQLGTQAYGSYHGGDIDTIGLVNGTVSLNFPILSYPQLGKLQLSFNLMYNMSRQHFGVWQQQFDPDAVPGGCWLPTTPSRAASSKSKTRDEFTHTNPNQLPTYDCWNWNYVRGPSPLFLDNSNVFVGMAQQLAVTGQALPQVDSSGCYGNSLTYDFAAWFLQMADGSRHLLGNTTSASLSEGNCAEGGVLNVKYQTSYGPFETLDATGWLVNGTFSDDPVPEAAPVRVTSPDGVAYTGFTPSSSESRIADANGNHIDIASGTVTDSLGRYITLPPTRWSATTSLPPGCPSGTTIGAVWSPPEYEGGTKNYQFCYATVQTSSNGPGQYQITPQGGVDGKGVDPVMFEPNVGGPLLQSIILPNGQSWQFEYNDSDSYVTYGTLSKITLPTGGTISYTYTSVAATNLLHCQNGGRWVSSRTVSANDGSPDQVWTYSYSQKAYWGYTGTTTVTDPAGNDTVHVFGLSDSSCPAFETLTQYYQGTGASRTLLKSVTTAYNSGTYLLSGPSSESTLINVVPTNIVTTVYANGASGPSATTGTLKTYDMNGFSYCDVVGYCTVGTGIYGKEISESVTDYNGNLLRTSNTSYQYQSNGSYKNVNLLNLVAYTDVWGPSGKLAASSYAYDESGLGPGGNRGNQTAANRWSNTGYSRSPNQVCPAVGPNSNVVTHRYYNPNGTANASLDACGQTTRYQYSSDSPSAFPISVTLPPTATNPSGFTTQYAYDDYTNVVTSITDVNNNLTTSYSYDVMRRLVGAVFPASGAGLLTGGGQVNICYTDAGNACGSVPNVIVESTAATPALAKSTIAIFDGLGRPILTNLASDPDGPTSAVHSYGWTPGVGRRETIGNPTRCGSSGGCTETTTGSTVKQYDALGRILSITYPNGDVVSTSYNLNCQTVTDEAGRKRSSCDDALGRLTSVTEDPSGLNLTTNYTYDALGNLTYIVQNGSRNRWFTYDSLSHLISANNPESGIINYFYDANGNLTTKVDGCNGVAHAYDQLNRLQSTWSWPTGTSGCSSATALSENYTYDSLCTGLSGPSVGLRTSMTDASGNTCWAYDNMKRAVTVQRTVNTGQNNPGTGAAPAYAIDYLYNFDGSLNQITYPSGRQLNYTLASNGSQTAGRDGMLWRVDATTGAPSSYISGAQYAPDGQIAQAALGQCGGGEYASYDQRLRPRHLLYSTAAASSAASEVQTGGCPNPAVTTDLMHKHYNYLTGDIESIANCVNLARSQMYTYDSLDRLSTAYTNLANASYPGWGEQYVIDAWGNLTNIDAYSSTLSGENFQFAPASAQNQLNFGTPSYYFDSVGNQKRSADGSHTFAYDADNRIASVDGASVNYTYDGDGDRMFKAQGTNGTVYWRGPDGQTLAESDLTGAIISEYIFFDGKRLARVDYTATPPAMEFYFEDHLGSTSMTMASTLSGSPPEDTDYYPFGGIAGEFGTGDPNHYKFTGKERDSESGLDMFGARYYGSSLGKFMTPDWAAKPTAVPYAMFGDPQSLNLYSYVRNNPTTTRDPDGHDALWVVDKQTGQVTLVIPVHFTGSSATPENISAITNRDNSLNTGGSPVKIQVVSTDKPVNGVLNTMDLSPGADTKNYGAPGEGVNKLGGNTGHINTDNGQSNDAAAHDDLHFAGIKDQYQEGPRDAQGNRTSTPTPGYDNSNIMTSRSGTNLKPDQIQEAQKNQTTKQCTSDNGKTVCK